MSRAGRWLLATYGRFLRLCAICVLFLLVTDLAYLANHAVMVGLALVIVVAAYLFTHRDQLKARWRRAHQKHAQPSAH